MSEWCGNCRFFEVGTTKAFPAAHGFCRRYAPRGPVIGCENNGWQVFPPMMANEWCGEHEPVPLGAVPKRNRALEAAFGRNVESEA